MNHIELLAQILTNNLGNKISVELAHGIVSVFQQQMPKEEAVNDTLTDSNESCDNAVCN